MDEVEGSKLLLNEPLIGSIGAEYERSAATVKALGAYYTPPEIAANLASLAISHGSERVLEPSAGDGALVWAALARSKELMHSPTCTVFACDINGAAVKEIQSKKNLNVTARNLDFLSLSASDAGFFDVVLSNPPFTRNHDISPVRRKQLRERFQVPGAPGIWVHFLLHSMRFIRPGGRLVSIVPQSAQFSDYSVTLLQQLREKFRRVEIVNFRNKVSWRGGAGERGAILIAEDFGSRPTRAKVNVPFLHNSSSEEDYTTLEGRALALCDFAVVSIGVVTGKNSVFLLDESSRALSKISLDDVTPVVSRARQVTSARLTRAELLRQANSGEKTWLLTPRKLFPNIKRYLAQVSDAQILDVAWFRKRIPWWKIDLGTRCDAVVTCMNHLAPRMALVPNGVLCTNTLHRIRFIGEDMRRKKLSSIVTLSSTFGQLQCERKGRVYGAALLKIEPSALKSLRVLMLPKSVSKDQLSTFFEATKARDPMAVFLADELTLRPVFGERWRRHAESLAVELARARASRLSSV